MNLFVCIEEERLLDSVCNFWKDVNLPFPVTFEGEIAAEISEVNKEKGKITVKILDNEAGKKVKALLHSGTVCGMSTSFKPNDKGVFERSAWFIKL